MSTYTDTRAACPRELIEMRLTHAAAIADELIRNDPGGERANVYWYFQDVAAEALRYIERGCPKSEQEATP